MIGSSELVMRFYSLKEINMQHKEFKLVIVDPQPTYIENSGRWHWPLPGKAVGPSFSAAEVPDVIEALLQTYRLQREGRETFISTLRRVGPEPFKLAANGARFSVARADTADASMS